MSRAPGDGGGNAPAPVTADDVPDPRRLRVALRVNERGRESAGTDTRILDVATGIAVLSEGPTLEPSDIIAAGTPSGVGAATHGPLKAGDVVEREVTGLGVLRNRVVADRGEPAWGAAGRSAEGRRHGGRRAGTAGTGTGHGTADAG